MIPSILPRDPASALLWGKASSWQSAVGFDLGCAVALRTGGACVVLTGSDEVSRLPAKVRTWRGSQRPLR